MFNDQFQHLTKIAQDYTLYQDYKNIHILHFHQAMGLFNRTIAKGRSSYLLFALLRRHRKLTHLSDLDLQFSGSCDLGIRVVLINHICGTQGRTNDFDNRFYPLTERVRDRWVSVATAYLEGIDLPPVDLIQVENKYFVQDGHHRISIAKAFSREEIEAKITLWMVYPRSI